MKDMKKEMSELIVAIIQNKMNVPFEAIGQNKIIREFFALNEGTQQEIEEQALKNILEQYEIEQQRQLYEYCASEGHSFGKWSHHKQNFNGFVWELPNSDRIVSIPKDEFLEIYGYHKNPKYKENIKKLKLEHGDGEFILHSWKFGGFIQGADEIETELAVFHNGVFYSEHVLWVPLDTISIRKCNVCGYEERKNSAEKILEKRKKKGSYQPEEKQDSGI